jgi:hypothetical protein
MQKNIPISSVPVSIPLGDFPSGLYRISFWVSNPLVSAYTLAVSKTTGSNDFILIKSTKQKDFFYIQFKHANSSGQTPLIITIKQQEGDLVFLKVINHPTLIDKSIHHNSSNEKLYSSNRLNLLFREPINNDTPALLKYKPVDAYTQLLAEIIKIQSDLQQYSAPKLPPGFYELLDLKNAKEQLDYVVNTKIHLHTSGNFISKPLKKMIKYLVTFIYKILTRSTKMKNYIAKFYRNFVNMNIISERTLP